MLQFVIQVSMATEIERIHQRGRAEKRVILLTVLQDVDAVNGHDID